MRFFRRLHSFTIATATLAGTIIGVGMFGIPFTASRAGLIPALLWLITLGGLVLVVHLLYGEVVLRTYEKHRLTGYARRYLGILGEWVAGSAFFIGLIGALLAYLIIAGEFLSLLLLPLVNIPALVGTLLLALVGGAVMLSGLRSYGFFEVIMTLFLLVLIFALGVYGSSQIKLDNLLLWGNSGSVFLPYGVILFSLWGASAIPEMRDFFIGERTPLKRAVAFGTSIPVLVYLAFVVVVVGISGSQTTPDAIGGLVGSLGVWFVSAGALVGLLAVITSFITLATAVTHSLQYDLKFPQGVSVLIALGLPLALFALGARNFINIIDWVGVILGSIEGVLIVLIHRKARQNGDREPDYAINLRPSLQVALIFALIVAIVSRVV